MREKKTKEAEGPDCGPTIGGISGVTKEIQGLLAEIGLKHVKVTPEGNCFYLAFSKGMYGKSSKWKEVRNRGADHIENNFSFYEGKLDEEETRTTPAEMRKSGIFADDTDSSGEGSTVSHTGGGGGSGGGSKLADTTTPSTASASGTCGAKPTTTLASPHTCISPTQSYNPPPRTIHHSCDQLKQHGLEYYSLGDLLELMSESSIEEVVSHLGLDTYASRTRAKVQLKELYSKFKTYKSQNTLI